MATPHISAAAGEIAPAVIMPGDPKRAERIADLILADARVVSDIRGNRVYTGTVAGEPLTVMASGMGMPSAVLYATELFSEYGVQRIVRVGTAGGIAEHVRVGDVVVAVGAHTQSNMNQLRLPGYHFSAVASYPLAAAAMGAAASIQSPLHVGTIVCKDHFYLPGPDGDLDRLSRYNVLAVEMESAGLYGAAAEFGREALTIVTISDHLRDHTSDMSADDRETRFQDALTLAVAAALS